MDVRESDVYPQGNPPDSWPQYNQQPDPYAPYGQPQPMPQYPAAPYQQPGGFPGQPYPGPPQGRRSSSRTPLIIIGVVVGVIVLVCAAGAFLVALGSAVDDSPSTDRAGAAGSAEPPPSTTRPATPTTPGTTNAPSEESIEGDLTLYNTGDCLTITGADNTVKPAKCTDSGAYKVLLRRDGTTDTKVCDSTDATEFLYQDGVGTSRDLVLCVAPAK